MTEDCKRSFMEMKWKKVHRYIVFKIEEKSKKVAVDKVGAAGESYDDLTASLPEDDCRYAVFDFDYVTVDNCRMSKIFFITWSVLSVSLYVCLFDFSNCRIYPFYHPTIHLPLVGHIRVKWSFDIHFAHACPKVMSF